MEPIYKDEYVTLYNADCRQVVPLLGEIELLLTDPPYGVTAQSWDCSQSVLDIVRASKLAVFTTGERLLADLIAKLPDQFRHIWVWDRVNHNTDFLNAKRRPLRAHELIAVFSKCANYQFTPVMRKGLTKVRQTKNSNGNGTYGDSKPQKGYGTLKEKLHPRSIIEIKHKGREFHFHPTQKPVALYEYLLQSYPSQMVVDPWAGSGTTLVAAKAMKRHVIGIEIDKRYCERIIKRLKQPCLF